jgi:integrase
MSLAGSRFSPESEALPSWGLRIRWNIFTAAFERRQMLVYDVPQTATAIAAVRNHRVFIAALLAAICGLRRGEIAAVRWRAVDLDKATLSVVQSAEQTQTGVRYKEPKRGRTRNVALSASIVAELKKWRAEQSQELLRLGVRLSGDTLICTTAAGGRYPAQ